MDDINEELQVLRREVPVDIMRRLDEPHSKVRPGIPFAWMLSYDGPAARQNIRYFENGVRHCALEFPIRTFFSDWSAGVVVSFVPLEAIREPHILEWFVTFKEVPLEEAKSRLERFPSYPYDGRDPIALKVQHLTDGKSVEDLLRASRDALAKKRIDVPRKW